MIPQARTLWYRVLHKKLSTASELFKIGTVSTPVCRLCKSQPESYDHFIAHCSTKWSVWLEILNCYYPLVYFIPSSLHKILTLQAFPPVITNRSKLVSIVAIAQWNIWKSYWNLILNQVAFEHSCIISDTIYQ
ncbi:hypothetical protein CU098_010696, partial [Rhizopus stolonifer]